MSDQPSKTFLITSLYPHCIIPNEKFSSKTFIDNVGFTLNFSKEWEVPGRSNLRWESPFKNSLGTNFIDDRQKKEDILRWRCN